MNYAYTIYLLHACFNGYSTILLLIRYSLIFVFILYTLYYYTYFWKSVYPVSITTYEFVHVKYYLSSMYQYLYYCKLCIWGLLNAGALLYGKVCMLPAVSAVNMSAECTLPQRVHLSYSINLSRIPVYK